MGTLEQQKFSQYPYQYGDGLRGSALAQTRNGKDELITPVALWELDDASGLYLPPGLSTNPRRPRVEATVSGEVGVSGEVDVSDRADRQLGRVTLTGHIQKHTVHEYRDFEFVAGASSWAGFGANTAVASTTIGVLNNLDPLDTRFLARVFLNIENTGATPLAFRLVYKTAHTRGAESLWREVFLPTIPAGAELYVMLTDSPQVSPEEEILVLPLYKMAGVLIRVWQSNTQEGDTATVIWTGGDV